jgi:hypothetical protein
MTPSPPAIRVVTQRGVIACGRWLACCLQLGWRKDQLDALEAIWWQHHDEHGHLLAPSQSEIKEIA